MKKELTSNQVASLICLCSISIKISMLPGYMSSIAGGDFWLVTIGMFLAELISFFIILEVAKKIPNKTFFQIVGENFNLPIRKIVEVIFLIFFIFKTVLSIYETNIFIKTTIYETFNEWIFLLTFMVFLIYMSSKDHKILGRASELVIYIAISGAVISLMLSVLEIDLSNVLPLFSNGVKPLLDCAGKTSFWFNDYLIFLMLMGNIKFEKNSIKRIVVSYSLTAMFITLFFITFYCLFKNTTTIHNTAISYVSHYIPRFNGFRLDWLSDILWIFVQVFTTGIWFYFTKVSFCNLFKVKPKNNMMPIAFALILIFIIDILQIPSNKYVMFLGNYCWWIMLIMSQLPLLMFICFKFGKRRKYYENALEE